MNFEINAGAFFRSLESVAEIAKSAEIGIDTENMISIKSDSDKIVAWSSGGSADIISEIDDTHFSNLSYKCNSTGEVTVNAIIMMKSLSVFKDSNVNINLDSNQLIISLCDDTDFVQCVPTYNEIINRNPVANNFIIETLINKEVLIEGIKKVQFAVGFEETQRKYMCLILENTKEGVRFIAGTGKYFAISDIKGECVKIGEKNQIIFPNLNLSNITSILSRSSTKDVEIKCAKKDDANNIPAQIILKFDKSILFLFKIDTAINYPDIDSILDFDYPNKIINDITEWKRSVDGIEAADLGNKSSDVVPNTQITVDNNKKCLIVETKGELKSKSKIKFDEKDSLVSENNSWFKCNSQHLKNVVSRGGINRGEIVLCFENQEPRKDNYRIKPILVKFPDNANSARNTIENFKLFFTVSTS